MNVLFVLHSKKALSDILEGVTSKTSSLAPLAGLMPSFFCMTIAANILVTQLKILQVFSGFILQVFTGNFTGIYRY